MTVYVDTSVLGAYYCPERLSPASEAALRRVEDPIISSLTEVEFFSLVAKKHRLKELTEPKARRALGAFTAHVADGYYRRLMLSAEHYAKARSLIGSFNTALHTLDALHLALAICGKLSLLTSDSALAAAARKFRVETTLVK